MSVFVRLTTVLLLFVCSCQKEQTEHLRLNLFCEPPTLDPRLATDTTSVGVLIQIYEGLMRHDPDVGPGFALAKGVNISEDGRCYTFKLRESFWSNGDPLVAQDFVHTWSKILAPNYPAPFAYKLFVIKNAQAIKNGEVGCEELGVRALDDHTLQVELDYPTPYFLDLLSMPTFFAVHPVAGVTNGPFLVERWEHESELWLRKNPLYWDIGQVNLQRLHFVMVSDEATELYMYENGELDWIGAPFNSISSEFLPALRGNEDFYSQPCHATYFYKLNTEIFPLGNKKIRQALSFAIDRKLIVSHVLQGGEAIAEALIPGSPKLFEDANRPLAKALFLEGLKEEGISLEEFPQLTLSYNTHVEHQKVAQTIQQQWKRVLDIDVLLEHCDWRVYLAKLAKRDYDIARMGWVAEVDDPVSFLDPYKTRDDPEEGGNNGTYWEHPEYISLLDCARSEIDVMRRLEHLAQAEALLIEHMPIIPLYFIEQNYMKRPYVEGVFLSPLGSADFKRARIAA